MISIVITYGANSIQKCSMTRHKQSCIQNIESPFVCLTVCLLCVCLSACLPVCLVPRTYKRKGEGQWEWRHEAGGRDRWGKRNWRRVCRKREGKGGRIGRQGGREKGCHFWGQKLIIPMIMPLFLQPVYLFILYSPRSEYSILVLNKASETQFINCFR